MIWHNAKIRDASVGIPVHTKVLVAVSPIGHTNIGKCWLVYDGRVLRQVAESFGGHGLYRVIQRGKVFSNQEKATNRIAPLLERITVPMHGYVPSKKGLLSCVSSQNLSLL